MISHAVVLVLLMQASEANDPWAESAVDAVRRGADATIRVKTFDEAPADADLTKAAENADAIAVVTWSPDHRRAHLHLLRVAESAFTDRDIGFDSRDAAKERGRTVGFALASMLPEQPPENARAENATTKSNTPDLTATNETSRSPLPPPRHPAYGAFEITGLAATGIGGYGGGGGGAIAGEWYVNSWLGLRLAFSGRTSEVGPVSATSYVLVAGPGARARFQRGKYELGAGVNALVIWHELSHLDADDPGPARESRVLPGGSAEIDVAWSFATNAALVARVGTEIAFGQTDLYIRGNLAAELVPVRALSELGLRAKF